MIPVINPRQEIERITQFIKETLVKAKIKKVVIGISGGIDSTTVLSLLQKVVAPGNIFAVHLPYKKPVEHIRNLINDLNIPKKQFKIISIDDLVEDFSQRCGLDTKSHLDTIRKGNIMARVRMIQLYDLAKKLNALVCGTENKSEYYLGYFTRFGDEASDFEPIRHLYKTQVYELAKYLNIPQYVTEQKPTAGLWKNQTDEGEFGFSYQEADQVLYLYFEQNESIEIIKEKGFPNADKIIERAKANDFKHHVPYVIKL